jgi:RHS repeat-associated protein
MTNTPATPGDAEVIWRASYEPFGLAAEELDPDGDGKQVRMPLRFPGQWWDFASNLHDNFYRTYDPATGRYLETDPIGQAGGLNLFVYAEDNPTGNSDPNGLQAAALALPPLSATVFAPPLSVAPPIPVPPWLGVPGAALGGYWVGTKIEPYVTPLIWPYLEKLADECGSESEDDCGTKLVVCLENQFWVPKDHPYSRPLDCSACYSECVAAGGRWPEYKCPLPKTGP